MPGIRNSRPALRSDLPILIAAAALSLWSVCAIGYFFQKGCLYYYGDAEAHLNIARRIVDSRTPGFEQLGSVWLPLPHIAMLPFVSNDRLWRSGLAGSVPAALCFVLGGVFLFAAVRRLSGLIAAGAATAAYACNPNLLYLQSTAMTEPYFMAALMALLYFSVRFQQTGSLWVAAAAGAAATAASLSRYEGWFILPAAGVFFLLAPNRRRWKAAALFGLVAALGPLFWLAHNRWYFGDALEFYRGPYSARAIQGAASYPGKGDWGKAWLYYRTAAKLCVGAPLLWLVVPGVIAAIWKRALWPVVLLMLPPAFYILSVHSAGTPIFVPVLCPFSYYNTRYGLALLPLSVFAAGSLVWAAGKYRAAAAVAVVAVAVLPWIVAFSEESWITWKEAQVNSEARRVWTRQAAETLRPYEHGEGVISSFGDMTGVFRLAGIPLRETLTGDNGPLWLGAVARPDLFLWQAWALASGGDPVQAAVLRSRDPSFRLEKSIAVAGAPIIQVYRREFRPLTDENSVHQSAWGEKRFPAHLDQRSSR
jgi:hypothetical protein